MKSFKEWLKESLLGTPNIGNPYQQQQQYHMINPQHPVKTVGQYVKELGRQYAPKFVSQLMKNPKYMGMSPSNPQFMQTPVDNATAQQVIQYLR